MTIKRIFIALLILIVLPTLYVMGALKWSYSSGERAGWVQKLSKKGWVCKTWEGEQVLVTQPGALSEKFLFTVHDEAVAEQINRLMGQRVSLHYEEKVGLPTSCFGDTRYFVTKVVSVEDAAMLPGPAGHVAPAPAAAASVPSAASAASAP
ncbi:hypothetical protein JY96_14600 [Aquabacterium sp. NJ1]|uniref:hypothetical protein n=1 Tax=Aquabacterium sp. NJ1 TaxID=1538295 RepID=UPI00052D2ED0|nr:hypothetical protein [Aquabacterium sp. NJ1]KGM40862.1 hypothetical protein JY96_14600 [Aquabacterium sp. NJ1]